jgi:protein phosphatase
VAHVGDSRAYLVRDGEMKPVTEDHSLVAELVRSGDLTRAQAAEHPQKNLITRALGADEEVDVDTVVLPVEAGDRVFLCTDGLSDMVPETKISEIVLEFPDDPEKASRSLLSAALDAGGNDNITVVVVDVREQAEREEPAAREEPRSGGTREMPAVAPAGRRSTADSDRTLDTAASARSRGVRASSKPQKPVRSKRRAGGFGKALGRLVRGLAVVLVVLVALTPAYLWGSSRYFFAFEEGEVVAYRGLPYAPLGVQLNREWQRPGLTESEIKEPYEEPVDSHKLYTRDQAEKVLGDLGR